MIFLEILLATMRRQTHGYLGAMASMIGGGATWLLADMTALDNVERIIKFVGSTALALGAIGGAILTALSIVKSVREIRRDEP